MGTTGHGIRYQDSNEPPQGWVATQLLAESVEAALDAYETWNSWTPVFTVGGFASVGAGSVEGFYELRGKHCHAEFRIELGSGFSVTAGIMVVTLPVPQYGWSGDAFLSALGNWVIRDDTSPNHYAGTIAGSGSGGTGAVFAGAWSGTAPNLRVAEDRPMVWAAPDIVSAVFDYRTA